MASSSASNSPAAGSACALQIRGGRDATCSRCKWWLSRLEGHAPPPHATSAVDEQDVAHQLVMQAERLAEVLWGREEGVFREEDLVAAARSRRSPCRSSET